MKKFLFIAFLLVSISVSAQSDIKNSKEFKEVVADSYELFSSDNYLKYHKLYEEFFKNIPSALLNTMNVSFDEWIVDNIDKTNFKSVEQARELNFELNSLKNDIDLKRNKIFSSLRIVSEKFEGEKVMMTYKNILNNIKEKNNLTELY